MRHASLCSCIAAFIAWSLDNVLHQCPGLISSSQAESGAPSHSRKRGWFNGTPRPASGRAWSSHLYIVCLNAQPFPKTRREACERSFGNGLLPVVIDADRLSIWASSHKKSLIKKSPTGAGFTIVVCNLDGLRDRRRCTDHIRSSTIGVTASESVVPT